jgi:hypothetical protein
MQSNLLEGLASSNCKVTSHMGENCYFLKIVSLCFFLLSFLRD